MITTRIGRQCSVTYINRNYNNICDFWVFFLIKPQEFWNSESFLSAVKKAILVHVCDGMYCPVT